MQYVQLRAFHAVAEHGSFSRAASALGLTQPAISDQVRRLEQEFGVTLFNRRGRTVKLTDLGRRLLLTTRQMFIYERNARQLLSAEGALDAGSLLMVTDAPDLAVKIIATFRRHYPNVIISLSITNAESCLARVLNNTADIAVCAIYPSDSRIRGQELRREKLMAVVPNTDDFDEHGLTFSEFVQHGPIFREVQSVTQRLLSRELGKRGIQVTPTLLIDGREGMIEAVAHGQGVAAISPSEFIGNDRVRLVPLIGAEEEMIEYIVSLADRPPSNLLDALHAITLEMNASSVATPMPITSRRKPR
ncbi:LysR family transcriptional regulator [Komagataeibacter diospyri]|uniref:LysR substrate-binding domain-containing protein n=1 Tax=Komagataeibacter diospyri TaxID=1932662 RepID=UPI0011360E1A|nr:LysR substrate-binding domain-containing protein [Komagataeibacter diospyri]GCE88868.1 LysR family transcriptional regulator [Komagataeibacter diospyri]